MHTMLTGPQLEERLSELVRRLQPLEPRKIVLFESSARGDADRLSDLDVIVVADRVAPRFLDRLGEAYELVDPHYALDVLVYTPEEYEAMRAAENTLIEAAEKDGRILFEIRCVRRPAG